MVRLQRLKTDHFCLLIHNPLSEPVIILINSSSLFLLGREMQRPWSHWPIYRSRSLELNWCAGSIDLMALVLSKNISLDQYNSGYLLYESIGSS